MLATAGFGLVVGPLFVSRADSGLHRGGELEERVAALEAERNVLTSRLERTLNEADRSAAAERRTQAQLMQALATNRDSVAYAQQLEAELRLRVGFGPRIERSAPPAGDGPGNMDGSVDPTWYGSVAVVPDLPSVSRGGGGGGSFAESDAAETRRTRERFARKSWDEVVQRAVIGECKGRFGAGRFDSCADDVETRLSSFQNMAQECIVGNFGGTFYLEDGNRLSIPTNGVTLDKGIVVFCDPNLRDGGEG